MFGKGFAENLISSTSNPFIGLFIGILATSIIQSSSTTTSIVVGLCGGGMLPIDLAIPIIMGANIGTTITNVLVSLTFITRKEDFKRAFSGATVHDFFNLFTVITLFPLELKFGIIRKSAVWLTQIFEGVGGAKFTSPLKVIISPAVHIIKDFFTKTLTMAAVPAGVVMLILALGIIVVSLVFLTKTMRALIIDKTEVFVDRYLFRNDLTAIVLGICLTVAVQSSSITTSLIIPLVGAGIITVHRVYPYTLGANIGTTCTALLASLATVSISKATGVINAVGVTAAFSHLMFNVFGIAIFYPLKRLPIACAERLGDVAARSKRWAFIFVAGIFFILPLIMIYLSNLFIK
jgi:sodium-dependent phosphate cotransporter